MNNDKSGFFLVREEILPEAIKKTIRVKEMLKRGDARTINEAVEIAKDLSGMESGKFVNGILDKASKELSRPARAIPICVHRRISGFQRDSGSHRRQFRAGRRPVPRRRREAEHLSLPAGRAVAVFAKGGAV